MGKHGACKGVQSGKPVRMTISDKLAPPRALWDHVLPTEFRRLAAERRPWAAEFTWTST